MENLEMTPLGEIAWGDTALDPTDSWQDENALHVYCDYRLSGSQNRRMEAWSAYPLRGIQGTGSASLVAPDEDHWVDPLKEALKDAARAGLREMLRTQERNRPKAVTGRLALANFPRYWIHGDTWEISASFRLEIVEIIPYMVY
jgi:hypothetical protein